MPICKKSYQSRTSGAVIGCVSAVGRTKKLFVIIASRRLKKLLRHFWYQDIIRSEAEGCVQGICQFRTLVGRNVATAFGQQVISHKWLKSRIYIKMGQKEVSNSQEISSKPFFLSCNSSRYIRDNISTT